MAKTTGSGTARKAIPDKTRCEDGGDEILVFRVAAQASDVVVFRIWICKANARVRLWITPLPNGAERLVIDETGKDDASAALNPSLPPGEYLLRWSTLTPAEKWQTRTEVSVNGTTCFRWRKKASSDNPVKGGTLLLVIA